MARALMAGPMTPDMVRQLHVHHTRSEGTELWGGMVAAAWARKVIRQMDAAIASGDGPAVPERVTFRLNPSHVTARYVGNRTVNRLTEQVDYLTGSVRGLRVQALLTGDVDERAGLQTLVASGARELADARRNLRTARSGV